MQVSKSRYDEDQGADESESKRKEHERELQEKGKLILGSRFSVG